MPLCHWHFERVALKIFVKVKKEINRITEYNVKSDPLGLPFQQILDSPLNAYKIWSS